MMHDTQQNCRSLPAMIHANRESAWSRETGHEVTAGSGFILCVTWTEPYFSLAVTRPFAAMSLSVYRSPFGVKSACRSKVFALPLEPFGHRPFSKSKAKAAFVSLMVSIGMLIRNSFPEKAGGMRPTNQDVRKGRSPMFPCGRKTTVVVVPFVFAVISATNAFAMTSIGSFVSLP